MINKIYDKAVATIVIFLLILGVTVTAIYTVPVHVLKDWEISVDNKTYRPGDSLYINSSSTKLRSANGDAKRILRCTNSLGITDYAINETAAIRGSGKRVSKREVKIPSTISSLPVKCKVVIKVTYRVYVIRSVTEKTESNSFKVEAAPPVPPKIVYVNTATNTAAPNLLVSATGETIGTKIATATTAVTTPPQKESQIDTPPLSQTNRLISTSSVGIVVNKVPVVTNMLRVEALHN